MRSIKKIEEIDISKQARALSWLRLTDYALVVLCGLWAISLLLESMYDFKTYDDSTLIVNVVKLSILCFAIYTGWRHVGVIDPTIRNLYNVVFPLLAIVCVFSVLGILFETGSSPGFMERSLTEDEFVTISYFCWVGGAVIIGWISQMLLLVKIPGIDATVDQLTQVLAQKAGTSADHVTSVKRISTPRGLLIGATGILILLTVSIFQPDYDSSNSTRVWLLPGFFLLLRARQYFQISVDSLLAIDRRPPILFLRSFDDDENVSFGQTEETVLDFSLETRLSNHFFRFGPFIAIGSPNETVPQIGAARILLADNEWQTRVLNWMRDAKLIVMYSGRTHWVNWELQQVIQNDYITKLLLIVPEIKVRGKSKRNKEIAARVEQIRKIFKNTVWEEELLDFNDLSGLRAMIFRPDGSIIMIKSRSRKRDSYHLAALIAHCYLLRSESDKDLAIEIERTRPPRRLGVAVGVLASLVIAVFTSAYLFTQTNDSRLTFKQGELYYNGTITQDEAHRVGEYLVQQEYFTDEKGIIVQLHEKQGQYRLQFVIKSEQDAQDPLAEVLFGVLGSQIAQNVLGGRLVEVGLSDEHLNPIRVLPLSAIIAFGKSQLYYTEPITAAEADAVSELLIQIGFFQNDRDIAVLIGSEKDVYHIKFIIEPSQETNPEVKAGFLELSRGIAVEALGGKPVVMHLCDENLRILQSEQI